MEIASKILLEEDRMKKRMHQQPQLFPDPAKEKQKVHCIVLMPILFRRVRNPVIFFTMIKLLSRKLNHIGKGK